MVPAACGSTAGSVSDSRSGKLGVSFRRLESEAMRPSCMLGGAAGVPLGCIRLAPVPMASRAASPPPTPTSFGLPAPPSTAIQHHQAQGRRWALAPLGLAFTMGQRLRVTRPPFTHQPLPVGETLSSRDAQGCRAELLNK